MGRIKILYISHSARIGGAEVCLLTLVKNLDERRFEPVVVFPTRGLLRKAVADLGIRTYVSPLEWWIRAQGEFSFKGRPVRERVAALTRIIHAEQPQLIHSNTSVVWEGALAAQLTGVPHLWHIHEILAMHPVLRPLFPLPTVCEIMNELSQQIVVVSEAVKSRLVDGIDAHKLLVISNGIDKPPDFQAQAVTGEWGLREELGLPAYAILAITVGSLVPEKGHAVLLEAAALMRRNAGHIHFILVGGGHPLAVRALKQQIRALDLTATVHYIGFRRDVQRLIANSDLSVLPSHTDAFPLAVLEAMAARKPVVATDSGGAAEMVVDGASGYLVSVGDAAQLAARIAVLAGDAAQREQMGRCAQQRFNERYTAQIYVERFQELYQQLEAAQAGAGAQPNLAAATQWMQRYDDLYAQFQAKAKSAAPLAWRTGRIARHGKQVARRWLYERE